ncbi:DNA polymerase eta isoform X2 [Tachyglossus aculeatus]|uniref:DNA polymerase eta isoform X2 n=1 Tax=Tachyglossus aculeatus TaxID=9261 RepID=UPI0018F43A28|nr:DNA polymerase eta isoform X2 [Tachyglossus aculeatus]
MGEREKKTGKRPLTCLLLRYREASVKVMEVMSRFAVIERASIDEAYVDLTHAVQERLQKLQGQPIPADLLPTTYVQGLPHGSGAAQGAPQKEETRQQGLGRWLDSLPLGDSSSPDLRLTVGAVIVEEMRAAVETDTGYQCSAGISHNKVLAKLACGLNKPNRQTLLSHGFVPELFSQMPIGKIRSLGGKLGASITDTLGVEYMGQLTQFTESQLQSHFGEKNGSWLFAMCRGIEHDPVKPRQLPKTVGCSKNFPGKTALATEEQVQWWLLQLALELEERLNKDRDDNDRVATHLSVSARVQGDKRLSSLRRGCPLTRYDARKMSRDALALIRSCNLAETQAAWSPPLTMLFLCAHKFSAPAPSPGGNITSFLSGDAPCLPKAAASGPDAGPPGGSPKAAAPKKGASALEVLFQKAAEKQRAREALLASPPAPGACTATAAGSPLKPSPPFLGRSTAGREPFFKGGRLDAVKPQDFHSGPPPVAPLQSSQTSSGERQPTSGNPPDKPLPAGEPARPSAPREAPEAGPQSPAESASGRSGPSQQRELPSFPDFPESEPGTAAAAPGLPDAEDQVCCEKCGSLVLAWEMPEHADYHFAVELQNSFLNPHPLGLPTATAASPSPTKRTPKSPLASAAKRPRPKGTQTLESFFKRLTR